MADRTILNPANANSLNGLFNGSTPISVSTLTVGFPPNDTVLSSNAPDSLIVSGTVTATGGITAESGVCQLGLGANSVVLTGTTGNLSVAGSVSGTSFTTITAGTSTFDDVNIVGALTLGVSGTDIQLSCSGDNVLTVGGSCIATGSFSAPYFGGGMLAGSYSTPALVAANSPYTITLASIAYNPITGWVPSSIFPQFTLTSEYGSIGIQDIALIKNGDNTLTIELTVYNPDPTNPQNLTSFYYQLFYQ